MTHHVLRAIELVGVVGSITSIGYYLACFWSAEKFLRDSESLHEAEARLPPVSILKPLKGTDPNMYECFRSHCLQEYPEYEIVFGVSDPQDPAAELVERLRNEFPQHAIRLVHCERNLGSNTKVSNLAQMLAEARYEYILVNDSDIRVPPDYLRRVSAPLADPGVGLVTCPYRGVANETLGSKLESLGISTDFFPGVLVARAIEGVKFGLGSTLLFPRQELKAIGGFEALVDYLGDDYQIGKRIAELGRCVVVSDVVVDSYLPRYTFRSFLDHQVRWARTVKDERFGGYLGLAVTFGVPWALLALIASGGALWTWALFVTVVAVRFALAGYIRVRVLRDRQPRLLRWLLLRDMLAAWVWLISFTGRTVHWRGAVFELKGGKLARIGT